MSVLLDEFYKDLLSVKSVNIKNNDEVISMEAVILVTILIADGETLEEKIQEMKNHYFLSGGFVMTKRLNWTWDDIEILESTGDKNE